MPKRSKKAGNTATKTIEITPNDKKDSGPNLPAIKPRGGLFGAVENDAEETIVKDYTNMEGFPYLVFMSNKSKRAKDIALDLGAVTDGTPAIFVDEEYNAMMGVPIMLLKSFKFWGIFSALDVESFALKQVRLDEPKDREESNAPETKQQSGWKESYVVLGVVFHKDFDIPMPFVCTVKSVKARWAAKLERAQRKSKMAGWHTKSDLHAELTKLPSSLRVCGTLKMLERQGTNGKYHTADINVRPTPLDLIKQAIDSQQRDDFNKLLVRGEDIFASREEEKRGFIPVKGIVPTTNKGAWTPPE